MNYKHKVSLKLMLVCCVVASFYSYYYDNLEATIAWIAAFAGWSSVYEILYWKKGEEEDKGGKEEV